MQGLWILLLPLALAAQQTDIESLQKSARESYSKGDYAAARQSLEQAWEQMQQSDAKDPKRYDLLKQLSGVLSAGGEYAAAQNYVELAINWRETVISRDDPKLADEWIELATLCQRQKDFPRAIALLQRAQYAHIRDSGAESLPVADDLSRMALVYVDDHKAALAAEPLERAIQIRETVLGPEHPAILGELDRLGSILINIRDYPQAEMTYRRAVVIRERLVGPNDASLIQCVEGLAYALFGQKKYAEAEPFYKRLLALWVTSTGDPTHPMVAVTLDKVAVFYRAQDRWREGTTAADQANALRGLFLSSGLSQEAAIREDHGDKKEAVRLYRQALSVLDPTRSEHTALRQEIEKDLRELGVEVKPVQAKPRIAPPKKQP
jgi:tetratricopeptide (TPR) repeat protein